MSKKKNILIAPLGLASLTVLSGAFLLSSSVSADDSVVDNINVTVPVSCSLSGTGMNSHNASIVNGTYQADIGTTTLKAFCNDTNGFAIYATGYTGNTIGETNSNKLVGTSSNIATGTATSGDTSNWAMKLATSSSATYPITLDNGFGSYSSVPNSYTKVAHRDSGTDVGTGAEGSTLTTTYAAYISRTQPADTYSGQVIYTLVHPSSRPAPNPAMLDSGRTVNSKLKSLANGTTIEPVFDPIYDEDDGLAWDRDIKSINVHLETPAPAGFIPSEANTISSSNSRKPIYIVFDNTDDAGIMHFYTEGNQIVLPSDSSFMFYLIYNLSEISGISDWDASNVTNMSNMFYEAGQEADTFALDLSSWDVSSVTDMSYMFYFAGQMATTCFAGDLFAWDTPSVTNMSGMFYGVCVSSPSFVQDLSSWDVSSVTDMSMMFMYAGEYATTFSLNVSSWDTSSVTNMSEMFSYAGSRASNFTLDLSSWDTSSVTDMSMMFKSAGRNSSTFTLNLSSWDTSSVTDMSMMFYSAGEFASDWIVTIPQTNGNSISNTTSRIYGKTTSFYTTPEFGRSFTLAQP